MEVKPKSACETWCSVSNADGSKKIRGVNTSDFDFVCGFGR